MVWTPDGPLHNEATKIGPFALQYLHGRALDLGCGNCKAWPFMIGVDNGSVFNDDRADISCDIRDLAIFADESVDSVFSSHALEDFPLSEVPSILKEWWRVLKVGGHLVLYLPHADWYPNIGQPGCNPMHKWDPRPEIVIDIMKNVGSWTLLENEVRSEGVEYSFFQVYCKDE